MLQRSRSFFLSAAAVAAIGMLTVGHAVVSASTLTWDPSGTTTGSDGSGTWNLTNKIWANGTGDVAWPNDSTTAVFGSTSSPTSGTENVSVSGAITAGGLDFADTHNSTYNIESGTIDAATGGLTISGVNTAHVQLTNLTITGAAVDTVASGNFNLQGTDTFSNFTVSSASQVQQQGTLDGAITLSGGYGLRVFSGSTTNAAITLGSNNVTIGSWVANSGTATLAGNINDGGNNYNLYFFASSPGSGGGGTNIKISGTGNTWGGSTYILGTPTNGTVGATQVAVQLGASNTLPTGTTLVFGKDTTSADNSNHGYLDLNGFNQTVAGLRLGNATGDTGMIGNSSTTSNAILTVAGPGVSTFGGTIQDVFPLSTGTHTVALAVTGGTLALTGVNNTYSGGTTISGGTLLADNASGSATGTGAVTVNAGGTLGGSGTVAGVVSSNGTLAPGNGANLVLTASGGVGVANNSILVFNLATAGVTGGTNGNNLISTTALTLGSGISLNITPGAGFGDGVYHLIDYTSLVDNSSGFSGWTINGLPGGDMGTFSLGLDGSFSSLNLTVSPVPEPAALGIMAMGAMGLLLIGRRRKTA